MPIMGNILRLQGEVESREDREEVGKDHTRAVPIRLNCADFGTFNGRSDQWINFKENILSKAGVGGYSQYLKPDFKLESHNGEGNQRMFYLLQSATNGGGAAHVVRKFNGTADGHGAWQALMDWYEGTTMSGEIARGLRTKLWALRLRPREEANRHINEFILYADQLKELGREEREETLIDLFLDSIVDTKYAVPVASCRLNKHITLEECYEAVRKYDNVITRENIREDNLVRFNKIRRIDGQNLGQDNEHTDISYKPYKEWVNLTPEERKAIHKARGEAQAKGIKNWNQRKPGETETKTGDKTNDDRNKQKGRKRARRVTFQDEEEVKPEEEKVNDE